MLYLGATLTRGGAAALRPGILVDVCAANDQRSTPFISKFHAAAKPPVSIADYLQRWARASVSARSTSVTRGASAGYTRTQNAARRRLSWRWCTSTAFRAATSS
jgi:hypothetical protein